MKKILKICLTLVALACGGYLTNKLYFKLTDGFSVGNIISHMPSDPKWDITPIEPSEELVLNQALSQKFTYLAKGHQAYAFTSEDGKFVIKFLKFHRNRIRPWLKYAPLPNFVEGYRQRRIAFKTNRMALVLDSWKMAYKDLKNENGLLFVQINPGQLKLPTIDIIDKIGAWHKVDLNQTTFLLQKRADLLCPAIEKCMNNHDLNLAKGLIDQFVTLLRSEYVRGFAETDPHVLRNTGFVDNQAIHIDTGRLIQDEKFKDLDVQKDQLKIKTAELRDWLNKHYPRLIPYLDERLRENFN